MNEETKFKLELIVKQYSHRTFIDKEEIKEKILEFYKNHHENNLPDETLSLVYSIKKLGSYCRDYGY